MEPMTQRKRKHRWVWLLVFAYIGFIFHNSLMDGTASSAWSMAVTRWIAAFMNRFGFGVSSYSLLHHTVRKLAHFTEFAGLGFLVGLAMTVSPLFRWRWLNFLLFLFAVPFSDEMIQRYVSGRVSQMLDMGIDCLGFLFGGLLIYILFLILKDLRKK